MLHSAIGFGALGYLLAMSTERLHSSETLVKGMEGVHHMGEGSSRKRELEEMIQVPWLWMCFARRVW